MGQPEGDTFFLELEREFFNACEQPGDAETIDQLYSSDFFSINADGSVSTKQGALEVIEAGVFPVCEEIRNDETMVRQYGDTAILTGRSTWIADDMEATVRHTQIWVKQDTGWELVGWQGTPVDEDSGVGPAEITE